MKKFLILFITLIILSPFVLAANWFEIYEKQYIDTESIEVYPKTNIVKFWVKTLRKDPNEKILGKDYWYMINKWALNCSDKKVSIQAIAVYDLKEKLLVSDSSSSYYTWDEIIPDSYADGFYRMYCLLPFDDNPLLQYSKRY